MLEEETNKPAVETEVSLVERAVQGVRTLTNQHTVKTTVQEVQDTNDIVTPLLED